MTNPNTLVIHPEEKRRRTTHSARTAESRLEETVRLCKAIRLPVVHAEICILSTVIPATHLGAGKVEYFKEIIAEKKITLVIVNATISPVQQRNLEEAWGCKIFDRTGLILEIFGARAHTNEGILQVELASLHYQKSRLVRTWTHLERQRGGFGFLAGPGETQIETDRRLLNNRITRIKQQLEIVVRTRGLHRKARQRIPYPVVALVGYTNAGKSTLFNYLTGASVLAEDALFATLDPTMRRVKLPSNRIIICSDTVGFITDLPTELVAAFRATLEEVLEADLILHVRDIAHPESEEQKRDVEEVLKHLGVEELETPIIEVWNKIDSLNEQEHDEILNAATLQQNRVATSAVSGEGCENLGKMIEGILSAEEEEIHIEIPFENGELLAWAHEHARVLNREEKEDHFRLHLKLSKKNKAEWEKRIREQ